MKFGLIELSQEYLLSRILEWNLKNIPQSPFCHVEIHTLHE